MSNLTERIKPFVPDIIASAEAGCRLAKSVITFHRMWVSCPSDHAAPALCESAFDEWLKTKEAVR